ncbi:unnamed protein product [Penicillium olsonii]|nr:unnamed protein product [Penicillium olsonii]
MAPMRIALEGCGHGSLNIIYDTVKMKADHRGWDYVDVVIVGGDFQSLRNSNDATAVSMPAKYRQIGDFHEYYSGKRAAPFLTIFLGGNHEASNYLSELQYGGWVAPNIYYLGAANIIRLGPLRISGISGIWKPYDYGKPHFERLPYNESDVQSIYHVRELDVRKLLQVRTQVDIGLSHDWPKGVEKLGDYITLFKKKRGFEQDSQLGRLGSEPAREILDHLRPALWFSAHLHVKYIAYVRHDISDHENLPPKHEPVAKDAAKPVTKPVTPPVAKGKSVDQGSKALRQSPPEAVTAGQRKLGVATGDTASRIAAWQGFSQVAQQQEMADQANFMAAFQQRQASGVRLGKNMVFEETLKIGKGPIQKFIRADGKRVENIDGPSSAQNDAESFANADKISLGSSPTSSTGARLASEMEKSSNAKPAMGRDAGVANNDQISLGSSSSPKSMASSASVETSSLAFAQLDGAPVSKETVIEKKQAAVKKDKLVEDDLIDLISVSRDDLPASLERSPSPVAVDKVLPAPEEIRNNLTKFMTLDKPRNHDPFIELIEFDPISDAEGPMEGPYRLQYDKEWLAITRAFADEFEFGNVDASVPHHKGYEYYQRRIAEEETWVQENIVDRGLLDVPDNFVRTAPVYDPSVVITTEEQPIEYTNPQTEAFCRLVGIENKLDMADEDRRARMAAGPRACDPRARKIRGRGGRGGRGRGGRGRGGRGRGRGNGGQGKIGGWEQAAW